MIPNQEKFFQTVDGQKPPASVQVSDNTPHLDHMRGSQQARHGAKANAGYATVQVANTHGGKQNGIGSAAGAMNPPKVPSLALGGDFNLADAPLRRLHDAKSYNSGAGTQEGGIDQQHQYMSTNQQMLTTEMDALRRPPVTVKQTDIIFLPDKGLEDATVSFDVSRKQANLPGKVPDKMMGGGGPSANSARGSSADRSSGLDAKIGSQGGASSNTYRGTSVLQPVSHHYQDLGDLMILSREEASLAHRMHIRDNLKARTPLGCRTFQNELTRGVMAINTSPDGHSVAILTIDFAVLIHDKVRQKTFRVRPLEILLFKDQVFLDQVLEQRKSFGGAGGIMSEHFKLFVSNGITSIYVVSNSERVIATWSNMLTNKPSLKKQPAAQATQVERAPPAESRVNRLAGGLFRSSSASKMEEKKPREQRSSSRLRDFFRRGSPKKSTEDPLARTNRVATQDQLVRSSSQGRLIEPQGNGGTHQQERAPEPVELLVGRWTNITVHSQNKQDLTLQALASANTMQYSEHASQEGSFATDLPIRFGNEKRVDYLGQFQEEGSIISVRMYDYASYVGLFSTELYGDILMQKTPQDINQKLRGVWKGSVDLGEMDTDTRKVIVFSQQFVEQDKSFKGGVWYQNPFYLVDKAVFATEIDYMGLIKDQGGVPSGKRTLISCCDNQGNLLAIAVNSMHKIYCQILFVSLKNQFVSVMKLFEFVSAEDNPPFDSKGKTNLQVDDLAWTRNDAFVILMFNTGALAVLPRLGSQLLKIYNPTIINVHYKDAANFTQYKMPRGFNELIPKTEIQAKVKKWKKPHETGAVVSANGSTGYRLAMHPSEDAFIIYSGSVAYIMQLELEPELEELFDQENKNYYFMRFCFSMKSLSRDQETLQKIPQLLTSKLPICEFEKNQEKLERDDDGDVAKRIQTASQINPWQMEERRMDTIQSFDADFTEEAERVLLNFKHLLFAYRWNAATTLNYLEWLITITNDIFFYYLKHSEPMYAYHSLKISEFYMTKVLEKTRNVNQYQVMNEKQQNIITALGKKTYQSSDQGRPDAAMMDSCDLLGKMFTGMLQRQMDPVHEIYSHGLVSQTLMAEVATGNQTVETISADLAQIMPPKKTLAEKIATRTQFLEKLPVLVASGDGNTAFAFQKNYALLSYYCLIQFRNYQANNFNILFLIIASYIFKKHVNASFIDGLQRISSILFENFLSLEKTNELDLFFGKCGRNVIQAAPQKLSFIQKWIELVSPHQSCYVLKVLNKKTFSQIQMQNYKNLGDFEDKNEVTPAEEIRPEVKPMIDFISSLEKHDFTTALSILHVISEEFKESFDKSYLISPTQKMGICLTLMATMMYHMAAGRQETAIRTVSLPAALECIIRMSIKLDKKSPINTVSQHSKIYDAAFVNSRQPQQVKLAKQRISREFDLTCETDFSKFSAMLLAYTGDFQRASQLLKPSMNRGANIDLLLFNILLQSQALKVHSHNFLQLIEILTNYSMKNIKDFKKLHQTTERLNAIQVVKFTMADVSCTMRRLMNVGQNSLFYREYLWASFAMLPHGISILFKEQVLKDAIVNIKTIFKFQIAGEKEKECHNNYPRKIVLEEFPLAKSFFENSLEGCFEHLEYILPYQTIIRRRFFQQIEVILVSMYDQHKDRLLFETTEELSRDQLGKPASYGAPDTSNNVSATNIVTLRVINLIIKNVAKFGKIVSYLKIAANIRQMDHEIHQNKTRQAGSTKTLAMVEAQIMICCNSLQHMIHFPKFCLYQSYIRRGLALLTQLLFHTGDVLRPEVRKKVLVPVIDKIVYSKYNRANKQLCSSILEMCKQKSLSAPEQFGQFVIALEASIYDKQPSSLNATMKPKHMHMEEQKVDQENNRSKDQQSTELRQMIEQVMDWMSFQVLPAIDWKKLNRKGHRRCIEAKKDMLRFAYTLHSKMGLRMTDCSFFLRGVNFEVKHANVFNLNDDDMKSYADLLAEDINEAEVTKLEAKNKQEEVKEEEVKAVEVSDDDDQMNKTRVEKMADQSVVEDKTIMSKLPDLDFKLLVMSRHQLFNSTKDLPQNCDLGDFVTMEGDDRLRHEIAGMEQQRRFKKEKQEQDATNSKLKVTAKEENALGKIDTRHIKNRSSFAVTPQVFSNQISLSELSLAQASATQADQSQTATDASTALESHRAGNDLAEEGQSKEKSQKMMGRIFAKRRNDTDSAPSGVKKITLRKNSVRRKLTETETILNRPIMPKPAGASSKAGMPPKPASRLPPKAAPTKQQDEDLKDQQVAKKKKLQPFSLVFLKKKKGEAAPEDGSEEALAQRKSQHKVKMPLKMIAKSLAKAEEKGNLEKPDLAPPPESDIPSSAKGEDINEQRRKRKAVKPFQVQFIRVNKKDKEKETAIAATAEAEPEPAPAVATDLKKDDKGKCDGVPGEPPVEIIENVHQSVTELRWRDKRRFMENLMKQLDNIQDRADNLKSDLATNTNTEQSSRKNQ